MKGHPQRGVVLVTVLWSIAMLSALAMAASVNFRAFAGIMAVDRDRVQAVALLTAGLETAAGIAAGLDGKPLAEIETAIGLSTGAVRVRLSDEGGRIDIGKAPADVLASLFRHVGAPALAAEALAQQVVALRKTRDAGPRPPSSPPQPQQPSNEQPFTDVHQLAGIAGIAPGWVAAIVPLATVFGNETVNPLTASPEVIAALPGVERPGLEAFLAMRRSGFADTERLAQVLGPAQKHLAVKPQRVVLVDLAARANSGPVAAVQAVIVLLPQDAQPYRVLVWNPVPSAGRL